MLVLQKLFEEYFHEQNLVDTKTERFSVEKISEVDEIENFDQKLLSQILDNLTDQKDKIDKIIAQLAPEWPIDKIAPIDLQILRIAILEGFILQFTPEKVAIDEAIELTKQFSNDQSRKFVSGVLGNLIENKNKYLNNADK